MVSPGPAPPRTREDKIDTESFREIERARRDVEEREQIERQRAEARRAEAEAVAREAEAFARSETERRGRITQLFAPELRARTIGGLMVGTVALVTFWVSSAFLPLLASFLAEEVTPAPLPSELPALKAAFVTRAMMAFNVGGLIGSLLAAPLALRFGRRPLFFAYFAWSTCTLLVTFVPAWPPNVRMMLLGLVALSTYGVFGAFQFYLPELFPPHLRGTGAGFCLNAGRFLTVLGPLVLAWVARSGVPVVAALGWLAIVPALGVALLALGLGVETRDSSLQPSPFSPRPD